MAKRLKFHDFVNFSDLSEETAQVNDRGYTTLTIHAEVDSIWHVGEPQAGGIVTITDVMDDREIDVTEEIIANMVEDGVCTIG